MGAHPHDKPKDHDDPRDRDNPNDRGDPNDQGDPNDHGDVDLQRILARWGILDAELPTPTVPLADHSEVAGLEGVDAIAGSSLPLEPIDPGSRPASPQGSAGSSRGVIGSTTTRKPFRLPRPPTAGAPGDSTRGWTRKSTRESARDSARGWTRKSRRVPSRTSRIEPRSKSMRPRRIVVGVLAAASLAMATSALVGASAETSKVATSLTSVASVTATTSSSSGAASQPSCRTFATREQLQPSSSASAVLRGDAHWKSVLQSLDRDRVTTLTAGDVAELDAVDAVGSPAARADVTTLCQLRAAGLRPIGWRTTLIQVHALSQTTTRVVLDIVDTRSAYDLVRNEDATVVSSAMPTVTAIDVDRDGPSRPRAAVVVAHRPARSQLHWLVTLSWNGTAWVIHDTAQVT